MNRIYLDYAATTPLREEALARMVTAYRSDWGNPSGIYATGRDARAQLDQARREVAACLSVSPKEVFFTSGGTESDNWALRGFRGHVITTAIEHHAVLNACQAHESSGGTVTYLPVDAEGMVDPDAVASAIRPDTSLISVMAANNEVGSLQPLAAIARISAEHGIPLHTDAVQAVGCMALPMEHINLLSLSAHKFGGPKGIGVLVVRGVHPSALIRGGAQERGQRAGTENVAAALGLAEALRLSVQERADVNARVSALRDRLQAGLLEAIPGARVNGSLRHRLPGHLNMTFPEVDGMALLVRLDLAGIAASAGAACTAGSLEPSHVLLAMGRTAEEASRSIRMTIGRNTTDAEVDEVLHVLPELVRDLRS